ncbi:MAG: hypothetical protein WCH91_14710, partial [bacterium]
MTGTAVNDAPVNTVGGAQAVSEDTALLISGISVNDVDGNLAMTELSVTNGTLTVSLAGSATISAGANGSGALTISGTEADINATLASLSYQGNPNFNGADTLTVLSTDSDGVPLSDSDTVAITVSSVNDAPINVVPSPQAVFKDIALTFSGANGNLISVSDVEATTLQVTLTVTNGTLTLSGTSGLSFAFSDGNGTGAGDGTTDTTMTFRGTAAAINTALAGMSYTPTAGFTGNANLSVTTSDLGSSGAGGVQTDVDTVTVAVIPRTVLDLNSTYTVSPTVGTVTSDLVSSGAFTRANNAAPPAPWTETGGSGTGAINTNRYYWAGPSSATDSLVGQPITIPADTSNTTYSQVAGVLTETTVVTTNAITSIVFDYGWSNNETAGANINVFEVRYGSTVLATFTTGGAAATTGSWAYGAGVSGSEGFGIAVAAPNVLTGTLRTNTLTLTAPLTTANNLTFAYRNGAGGAAGDRIAIDNVVANNTATTTTTVTTVDIADTGWTATYTENGAPVAIADTDSSIYDIDSANMVSASILVANAQTGDRLLVNGVYAASGTVNGISYTRVSDTSISLTSSATKAQYADALELIQFENTTDDPSTTPRTVNVTVNDGTADSNTAVATINVVAVNDEPTLVATGGTPTYTEDGSAVDLFSGVTVATVESGQTLTRLDFTVTNVADGSAERITVDGTTIQLVNGGSGTTTTNGMGYTVSVTGNTATVSLTKIAGISTGAMQTLVDGMGYQNTSQNPTTAANRVVTVTRLDDNGAAGGANDNTSTPNVSATVT